MFTRKMPLPCVAIGLMALVAPLGAGEQEKPDAVVAQVNGIPITRQDLSRMRRYLIMSNPQPAPDNRQILDYAINCVLWNHYTESRGLRPSGSELQRAIQWLDFRLREQGSSYQKSIAGLGLTAEEDAANLQFECAMQRLANGIWDGLTEEEVRAEFDARPEWYDGSRICLSEIFVATSNLAKDPGRLEKAKRRIQECHEQLLAGKDFGHVARDYSDGSASAAGGELGWFFRNGSPVDQPVARAPAWPFEGPRRRPRALENPREPPTTKDEVLITAAWALWRGAFTKPIQTMRGWHILKVTERDGAHFTFLGAQAAVSNALTRRRMEGILEKLRADAKIETYLQSQ